MSLYALYVLTGDIQVFQACVQLVALNLDKTYVHGDIQAFQATRKLVSLELQGTQVFGELAAFHGGAFHSSGHFLGVRFAEGENPFCRNTMLQIRPG